MKLRCAPCEPWEYGDLDKGRRIRAGKLDGALFVSCYLWGWSLLEEMRVALAAEESCDWDSCDQEREEWIACYLLSVEEREEGGESVDDCALV